MGDDAGRRGTTGWERRREKEGTTIDILGLDADFRPVKALQCMNIQWNRRYYEAGEYQLQLRAADYDERIAFVYASARPETGMVQKVETEHNVKGDFVLLSGYFLEGMLNWKAVYPRYMFSGNLSVACRALTAAHMAEWGIGLADGSVLGTDAVLDVVGDPLGDVTYGMLQLQQLSQRIRLDYGQGKMLYEVWQGLDRTQSQTAHPYAVFSQDFGTVDALTLTRDSSDYRNYAIAAYEGGALTVDLRTDVGEPRRTLYVDTGLAEDGDLSGANFLAAVETAARAELARHAKLVNLDATVLQGNTRYRVDYDLGDLCDVRDDRLSLAYEARIVEVNEVWKNNAHTVSLQFGDKIPTAYQQGRF